MERDYRFQEQCSIEEQSALRWTREYHMQGGAEKQGATMSVTKRSLRYQERERFEPLEVEADPDNPDPDPAGGVRGAGAKDALSRGRSRGTTRPRRRTRARRRHGDCRAIDPPTGWRGADSADCHAQANPLATPGNSSSSKSKSNVGDLFEMSLKKVDVAFLEALAGKTTGKSKGGGKAKGKGQGKGQGQGRQLQRQRSEESDDEAERQGFEDTDEEDGNGELAYDDEAEGDGSSGGGGGASGRAGGGGSGLFGLASHKAEDRSRPTTAASGGQNGARELELQRLHPAHPQLRDMGAVAGGDVTGDLGRQLIVHNTALGARLVAPPGSIDRSARGSLAVLDPSVSARAWRIDIDTLPALPDGLVDAHGGTVALAPSAGGWLPYQPLTLQLDHGSALALAADELGPTSETDDARQERVALLWHDGTDTMDHWIELEACGDDDATQGGGEGDGENSGTANQGGARTTLSTIGSEGADAKLAGASASTQLWRLGGVFRTAMSVGQPELLTVAAYTSSLRPAVPGCPVTVSLWLTATTPHHKALAEAHEAAKRLGQYWNGFCSVGRTHFVARQGEYVVLDCSGSSSGLAKRRDETRRQEKAMRVRALERKRRLRLRQQGKPVPPAERPGTSDSVRAQRTQQAQREEQERANGLRAARTDAKTATGPVVHCKSGCRPVKQQGGRRFANADGAAGGAVASLGQEAWREWQQPQAQRGGETELVWRWMGRVLNAELEVYIPSEPTALSTKGPGGEGDGNGDATVAWHKVVLPLVVPDWEAETQARERKRVREMQRQRVRKLRGESQSRISGAHNLPRQESGAQEAEQMQAAAQEVDDDDDEDDDDEDEPVQWKAYDFVLMVPVQVGYT